MNKFCTCAIVVVAAITTSVAQSPLNKRTLLTLQPGEIIVTGESCIEISETNNALYLVTRLNGKIFIYDKGQRKGPFSTFNAAGMSDCDSHSDTECSIYKAENTNAPSEFITYTDDGHMSIKFKGKTYGPYQFIKEFFVSPDKSVFTAIAAGSDMKFLLVSSEVQAKPITANISSLSVSSSGKTFLAIEKEGDQIDPALLNIDYSKLTTEQMMQMAKDMEEKKKKAGEPHAYIYTNGGKKFGPYAIGAVSDYSPAFCITGGDNWYMLIDNALYVNGIKIKEFTDIYPSACNVWLSADGKRYAVVDYENIIFSDGSKYHAPLRITTENKDGKTLLKWISLENEKELISYSREL
jgi:hypothetical protein